MKAFLIRVVLFAAILIAIDKIAGVLLHTTMPFDFKIFLEAKQDFFRTDKDYDVVIIGDSHVADGIDPKVMEDSLHLSVFNLGVYHASPYECYYLAKAVLQHQSKKPKIIILGTNPIMFNRKMSPGKYTPLIINNFLTKLGLYYFSEDGINGEYFFHIVREKYLFKSLLKKIMGEKYVPTRSIENTYNGYLKNTSQIAGTDWNAVSTANTDSIIEAQVGYFNKTIELLSQENIKVVVANTPLWENKLASLKTDKIFIKTDSILKMSCKKNHIDFFNSDYSVLRDTLVKSDFLNTEHLNSSGAQKYTSELSKWLRDTQEIK
jgi:hypothetical protein